MDPQIIEVTSEDGFRCKAALAVPEGDPPFPGILLVHGGMGNALESQLLDVVSSERLSGKHLLLEGYAVLASDYRHPSLGYGEVMDTVAAYLALRDHPSVDARRTAMVGTSHGAVNVMLAGTVVTPRCIVEEEGATDFAHRHRVLHDELTRAAEHLSDYQKLDKQLFDELAGRMGGTPDEVPGAYEAASGHSQADKFDCPVLIITGESEYQPNCVRMYEALVAAGKDCTLKVYEGAPHGFWWHREDIPAFVEADGVIRAFLARHLMT